MKINTLQLENFRGFKSLELFPNGKSMIIFGKNGTGKSSILRAIRYIISYMEANLSKNKGSKKNKFLVTDKDIYCGEEKLKIVSIFSPENLTIIITYPKDDIVPAITISNMHSFDLMNKKYREDVENDVIVYYGIDRYIYSDNIDLNVKSKNIRKTIDKLTMTSIVDFSSFVYWYRETQENYYKSVQEKISGIEADTTKRDYDIVQNVISNVLDGCKELSYVIENGNIDLVFSFVNEKKLKYEQLSDGEKTMVSLFVDITMRLCENNKYCNCPLNCGGIVVIDEIEQHLHLSWQRTVLNKLKRVFPNIQFIITTHSPIVLSEASDDYYLVGLKNQNDMIISEIINAIGGYDIGYIISKFFETCPDSEKVIGIKNDLDKCMKNNDIEGAKKAIQEWEKISGKDNIDIEFAKLDLKNGD